MEASRKLYCEGNMSRKVIRDNGNESDEIKFKSNFYTSQVFCDNLH